MIFFRVISLRMNSFRLHSTVLSAAISLGLFLGMAGCGGGSSSDAEGPKDFPEVTLQINAGGGRNAQVAEAVQKMLQENLGISVQIQQVEFAQHYENLESGKARFWRAGWVADYPDPENFLNLLYGGHVPAELSTNSYVNSVRYISAEYDAKFTEALRTVDDVTRMNLYRDADQIQINDAAILPLYYNIDHRLLQPYVRNCPQNPMEYRLFTETWLDKHPDNPYNADLKALPGGVNRGGVFRYNETQYLRSMFPLNVSEVVGHRIVNQVYEGLIKLNHSTLAVEPALAESWTVSDDARIYTFTLRKGVRFHDDPCFTGGKGREVTANDFAYCFEKLCTPDGANKGFSFVVDRIKGARAYYDAGGVNNASAPYPDGIKILNDRTFQIELAEPFSAFIGILSMPFCYAWPREALEAYGMDMRAKAVGTGPFIMRKVKDNDNVVLVRNEDYWGRDANGNALPYLDGINIRFISEEKSEMLSFQKGEFELKFRLPTDMYDQIVDRSGPERKLTPEFSKYQLQYVQNMMVEYYGFLNPDPDGIFSNKLVRQAFNYAIDRDKLCDFVMKGTAAPAIYGIVPPAYPDYPYKEVKGFTYDPDRARYLLQQAGYK
jgi:ABC-type transport system substrate-binding protein